MDIYANRMDIRFICPATAAKWHRQSIASDGARRRSTAPARNQAMAQKLSCLYEALFFGGLRPQAKAWG